MNYSSVIKVPDEKALDALCAKMFNQLLIHPNVIVRIRDIGYKLPTAIQAAALPLALFGKDLIVQSPPKSGKTLVFAALAATIVCDNHQSRQREPFVTILAASSEHVTKIKSLIVKLVPDDINVCAFYGDGDDFTDEKIAKRCSVVIGTPDRMAKLCADGGITIKLSQLLILDDADKLMAPTFVENIQSVFKNRGSVVQVAAFCSSYPDGIERFLQQFMGSPSIIRIDSQDVQLSAANRDIAAVEDNTLEIDDGIAQSDQLLKNVSSNESSASPTKTLPGSSRNANVHEPPMESLSTNANVEEPLMASAVQLSSANRDDKVDVKDNTPETDDGIAASQSEQLSKNVSSDGSSATKTSSGDRQDVQVAIEDKTPEIDRDVKDNTLEKATSQSDQLSKNVSSNESTASPTKTLPGSSTNANIDEPSMASQSAIVQLSTANRDDKVAIEDKAPEIDDGLATCQSNQLLKNVSSDGSTKTSSGDRQDVQLNAADRDDKVAIEDKTPEIDRDVKDNTPEKATSQSDQLSKNAQNTDGGQGFGSTCGRSRGGFGQSNGFGSQNNDSDFGSTRGGRSGGFGQSSGFGSQNNDGGHGFGSTRGGRSGGFGQSSGFGSQNNENGFGSTRGGSRGGYGQSSGFGSQNNDSDFGSIRGGRRGSFGQSSGFGAQNNDNSFVSTRGGSRGGFGQSSGFGAQNNDGGRSFGNTRGGSRGGFGQSSGFGAQNNDGGQSFGNTRCGSRDGLGGGSKGGYNRSSEFGGDNQMNSSRGGFGHASRGSYGRGGFGQSNVYNQQDSNGFGENQMNSSGSNHNRGGFGNLNSAQDQMNSSGSNRGFPSRGGFGSSNSAENQINSPVLNRGGSFHSNSDGQSSHGGFGSGFGHPATDNSQDARAPEDKPQPLVLGHRFVR